MTPTPEATPEATPEVTPTADLYVEMTTPGGFDARLDRTISAGEGAIIVMLALLFASIWAMYIASAFRERRKEGFRGSAWPQ